MDNVVSLVTSKPSELEFVLEIDGLTPTQVSVRLCISTEKFFMYFDCEKKGKDGTWICQIPPLNFIERGTYPYHVEVIADGYFFNAVKGTANASTSHEVYVKSPDKVKPGKGITSEPSADDAKKPVKDVKKSPEEAKKPVKSSTIESDKKKAPIKSEPKKATPKGETKVKEEAATSPVESTAEELDGMQQLANKIIAEFKNRPAVPSVPTATPSVVPPPVKKDVKPNNDVESIADKIVKEVKSEQLETVPTSPVVVETTKEEKRKAAEAVRRIIAETKGSTKPKESGGVKVSRVTSETKPVEALPVEPVVEHKKEETAQDKAVKNILEAAKVDETTGTKDRKVPTVKFQRVGS